MISFVTAMDSNTYSIADLCRVDTNAASDAHQHTDPAMTSIKIFWGVLIGTLSLLMTVTTGIDGVRILSNLGGIAGLLILITSILLLIKLTIRGVTR